MLPTLYLAICLLPIVAVFAEIITARRQELARPSQYSAYRIPPTAKHDQDIPDNDAQLLDIVLVASVDGKFHAMNRRSGQTLWSMSASASTTQHVPSTLAPLVRTVHNDHDPDLVDEHTNQETYVIEPQSGDIYVMATPSSSLQRFPFSMAELVDMSPFSFADSEDRRVFVGRKETSLLLVELETGRIKATLNSECPWDPFEDFQDDEELDLDELEGSKPKVTPPTEVFIGRTDYHISIVSRPLKNSGSPPPPVQNLSFSTYGPNNQDNVLQAAYRRPQDDAYIQGLPNGHIISFKARSESQLTNQPPYLWMQQFVSPIVAVFDVLQKPSAHAHGSHTFVLLQPRPGLQELLPSLSLDTAVDNLPNHQSAYVGMVQETGSLFAMSPLRYPLVAFGGIYSPTRRQIDSLPVPTAVDDITRARKEAERQRERERLYNKEGCEMETGEVVTDRRCLIGIRPLEGGDGEGSESRLKRLLNGSPSSHYPQLPGGEDDNDTSSKGKADPIRRPDDDVRPGRGWLWDAAIITVLGAFTVWFGVSLVKGQASSTAAAAAAVVPITEAVQFIAARTNLEDNALPVPDAIPVGPPTPASPVVALPDIKPTQSDVTLPSTSTLEDSDKEGEPDPLATPGKKKARRGGRGGKKKKGGAAAPSVVETDDERKGDFVAVDAPSPGLTPTPSSLVLETKVPVASTPSLVVSETVLGFGSHGTVVFQGSLQGRSVAVKRLLQDFVTLAAREVSILQESDDHPNVIRYYYQESHSNFLYIALELCPASLADIVENPDRDQWRDVAIAFDPKKALRQITSGLRHLHALKLVHRDIKPQNILVSDKGKMLISDFGLCKKLDLDQTSFLPTAHGAMAAGTVGWRAPEILRGDVKLDELGGDDSSTGSSRGSTGTVTGGATTLTRLTKSVDIFALGCLFYYVLSNGGHPYGDRFSREMNILKNEKNLEALERFGEEGSEAAHLIERMLNPEAHGRPDTTTCLVHPFFWDPGRRLSFLQDASDRFEVMCRDPRDVDLVTLEKGAQGVVGNDWQTRLDKIFIENLGKFRKYDGKSVQDLLRALRNKKHHYQDLPDNVKRHLGSMPEGYLSYFTRRYPRLILHVHRVVGETSLRTESMFRTYYELAD